MDKNHIVVIVFMLLKVIVKKTAIRGFILIPKLVLRFMRLLMMMIVIFHYEDQRLKPALMTPMTFSITFLIITTATLAGISATVFLKVILTYLTVYLMFGTARMREYTKPLSGSILMI